MENLQRSTNQTNIHLADKKTISPKEKRIISPKKKKKLNLGTIGVVFVSFILFVYFISIAYPLFWMVINSFKTTKEIFTSSWTMPEAWLISNYTEAWNLGISTYFFNSVIITTLTCAITVFFAALCAYGLSRFQLPGEKILLLLVSAGLMFAPQVGLIPLYELSHKFGIYDTYWALILPYTAYRLPLAVLIIRAYFLSIPKELEEAARIDGCSDLAIFFRIFIPISIPILFTSVILTAYFAWNEILFSVIFIESEEVKPITAGLLIFRDALRTDWGILMAGLVMSAIPLIILFIFAQKYFIRGLAAGSVKG